MPNESSDKLIIETSGSEKESSWDQELESWVGMGINVKVSGDIIRSESGLIGGTLKKNKAGDGYMIKLALTEYDGMLYLAFKADQVKKWDDMSKESPDKFDASARGLILSP